MLKRAGDLLTLDTATGSVAEHKRALLLPSATAVRTAGLEVLELQFRFLRACANSQAAKPVENVERYSEGEEQGLKPESDRKLRKMLRFHLRDRLTSGLAAGSQTNGQNLATGSANLGVTRQSIDALLEDLKDLNGDPTVK
jgi:hypothetical protein